MVRVNSDLDVIDLVGLEWDHQRNLESYDECSSAQVHFAHCLRVGQQTEMLALEQHQEQAQHTQNARAS